MSDFSSHLTVPAAPSAEVAFISWHWYLLEKLMPFQPERVSEILLQVLNQPAQALNYSRAAEYLIKIGRIEGMAFCLKYLKESMTIPFEHKWRTLQEHIGSLPVEEAINIFLSMLDFICFNAVEIQSDRSYNVEEAIYGSLITLSQKDFKYYTLIKANLTKIIQESSKISRLDSLKAFSERLTQNYFESVLQEVDIPTANLMYQSLILKS